MGADLRRGDVLAFRATGHGLGRRCGCRRTGYTAPDGDAMHDEAERAGAALGRKDR